MDYIEITQTDYPAFYELANAYYREGEDAASPQDIIDPFIRMMFDKVISREISGCLVKEGDTPVGFALWVVDTENFAFSQLPGLGTVLEIGLIPSRRHSGWGRDLVAHVEDRLRRLGVSQCYVSAYGPAQAFWRGCGYVENGNTADNGLPIMVKTIL